MTTPKPPPLADLIAECEHLDREASPGPWTLEHVCVSTGTSPTIFDARGHGLMGHLTRGTQADLVFATRSRTLLLQLAAHAEALADRCARLERALYCHECMVSCGRHAPQFSCDSCRACPCGRAALITEIHGRKK